MLRSGRVAKNCDVVVLSLFWPHTSLKFSYASRDIRFEDLDTALLVAGELEIQNNPSVDPLEKAHRLALLQSIMYFSKRYSWNNCLDYFGAILAHVERGGSFGDSEALAVIQLNTLNMVKKPWPLTQATQLSVPSNTYALSHYVPSAPTNQAQPRTWFCQTYQQGLCSLLDPHEQLYHGQPKVVSRICDYASLLPVTGPLNHQDSKIQDSKFFIQTSCHMV